MVATARLSVAEIRSKEVEFIEKVRSRAAKVFEVSPEQVIVRDILPKDDFGLDDNKWVFSLGTAGDYNKIIDVTAPQNKVFIVYGLKILSKDVDHEVTIAKVQKGNEVLDVITLEKAYNGENYPEIIFRSPIEINPNDTLKVYLYVPSGVTTPKTFSVAVLGYTAEKLGETITSALEQ